MDGNKNTALDHLKSLNTLALQIEKTLDSLQSSEITQEAEKMYTYYAMDFCLQKLSNSSTEKAKNGILRTKKILMEMGLL